MLKDIDFDLIAKPVIDLYSDIELELLELIADKFIGYKDGISGSMEWWLTKLQEMNGLTKDAVSIIARRSNLSEEAVYKALEDAGFSSVDMPSLADAYKQGVSLTNPTSINFEKTLRKVFNDTNKEFVSMHTEAIEGTKQAFKDVLNKTYAEVTNGVYSYDESIRKNMQALANRGITGATYERKDGTEIHRSLESTVRSLTVTSLNQAANEYNEQVADEMGAKHFITSAHLGARNRGEGHENHQSWQGIPTLREGSSDEYPNHYELTGEGEVDGLGGVNCRHHKSVFFPGITVIPDVPTAEENARVTELLETQRKYERRIRQYKRKFAVASEFEDGKMMKSSLKKKEEYQKLLDDLVKKNEDVLKRDSSREQLAKVDYKIPDNIIASDYIITTRDFSEYGAVNSNVVYMPRQRQHTLLDHYDAYVGYSDNLGEIIDASIDEFIGKEKDTIYLYGSHEDRLIKSVIKLNTDKDSNFSNSVITTYYANEKTYQKDKLRDFEKRNK